MDQGTFDFPLGIPGFADCHRFSLSIVGDGPLHYLTALDDDGPRFAVVDPGAVIRPPDTYSVRIEDWAVELLGLKDPSEARVVIVLNTAGVQVTANLLGPIVLNESSHIGCQIVADGYPLRAALPEVELSCSS
jgi:flagellar assembly factor FliW